MLRRPVLSTLAVSFALLASVVPLTPAVALVHPTWDFAFPQAISYKLLSNSPRIDCGKSDAEFLSQVRAEGVDKYQIVVATGRRNSCERRVSEQFKRLFPGTLVLNYHYANGGLPTQWPNTWPGYYLMMNRSSVTAAVTTTATYVNVVDPLRFNAGDAAVVWTGDASDPYAGAEYVKVKSVSGTKLTIERGYGATPIRAFATGAKIAALAMSPTGNEPMWNFSTNAPSNPANGKRGWQWLADRYVDDFAPSTTSPSTTLDGIEFDVAQWFPVFPNVTANKDVDCDGDGVADGCTLGLGTASQMTAHGAGYDQFVTRVKTGLQAYDTDLTRPVKLVLGDYTFRSVGAANGAEFESFPSWDDYSKSSGALADLGFFVSASAGEGGPLSYAMTKDITPTYAFVNARNPNGCVAAEGCRNGSYRYGMTASLVQGAAHAYLDEFGDGNHPVPWDEDGTVNTAQTGLAPGWLGDPLGAAQRVERFTSGDLVVNGGGELGLTSWSALATAPALAQMAESTDAAVGAKSITIDVPRIKPAPAKGDAKLRVFLGGPSQADTEYTISFWAKVKGGATGTLGVREMTAFMDGVSGSLAHTVKIDGTWRHFDVVVRTTTSSTKPKVTFLTGRETGTYAFDDVQVHKGSVVMTREFEHGIAVLNDSFGAATNVPLPGGTYRRINGVQDRTVNNGTYVGSTLPSVGGKDGILLRRES